MTIFTSEDVIAMTLPQARSLLAKSQEFALETLRELEAEYQLLMQAQSSQTLTPVTVTGYIARGHFLAGQLLMRKSLLQRFHFYAQQDFRDKFREKIKMGPRGNQSANGFAWAEREAAAESMFVVEKKKADLLHESVDETSRALAAADSFIWGAKALQSRIKMDHEDQRFTSNKHFLGDSE